MRTRRRKGLGRFGEKFRRDGQIGGAKISGSNDDAEDLGKFDLGGALRLEKEAEKTKLSYFSGRGSLAGWLRAVTNQLAIDGFRKNETFVQIEEDREFENLAQDSSEKTGNEKIVSHTENPEEIFSERQTAERRCRGIETGD